VPWIAAMKVPPVGCGSERIELNGCRNLESSAMEPKRKAPAPREKIENARKSGPSNPRELLANHLA
jgi:hypothetical protein